ncbi:MAG: twin-arginine translocase subunit TatC, partial [Acidimicrobiales bacterium]|nr:twin-arginine translocase subunit TatC [Acidimicrobiales bacterium]
AHLSELRRRLISCMLAAAVGTAAAWLFYDQVVAFMIAPYRHFLLHHPHLNISGGNLVALAPLEGFTTRLKVCGYLGVGIAAPVLLWQAWRFVAPGLYRTERRYAAAFVAASVSLFALGAATAVFTFPKAVSSLISVGGSSVAPLFSPGRYLGLYALYWLVFGVAFTYPVVLVFLEVVGILSSARLRQWRRYAVVVIVAAAALITPSSDPFSFLAMAVPLVAFYEGSILIGRALKR